ncbi:MAG: nitrous oxide-stimulated promoter family protein [Dehalococcoidales bacterium]
MPKIFERLDRKKSKDIRVLANFISIFCRENHREEAKSASPIKDVRLHHSLGSKNLLLCHDCQKLLNHGIAKLLLCPYDPKPMCKKCETHCYAPGYRERIREVMRFSGLYLVKHGRLNLMIHYFF